MPAKAMTSSGLRLLSRYRSRVGRSLLPTANETYWGIRTNPVASVTPHTRLSASAARICSFFFTALPCLIWRTQDSAIARSTRRQPAPQCQQQINRIFIALCLGANQPETGLLTLPLCFQHLQYAGVAGTVTLACQRQILARDRNRALLTGQQLGIVIESLQRIGDLSKGAQYHLFVAGQRCAHGIVGRTFARAQCAVIEQRLCQAAGQSTGGAVGVEQRMQRGGLQAGGGGQADLRVQIGCCNAHRAACAV